MWDVPPMQRLPRIEVLGVPVDCTSLEQVAERTRQWIEQGEAHYVCLTGVHGVMESVRNRGVLNAHQDASLVLPDGMPLVWAARTGGIRATHIRGTDLMAELTGAANVPEWRHVLFGSDERTLALLRNALLRRNPELRIVGEISPAFSPRPPVSTALAEQINGLNADIVWVGLSTPKQEIWMQQMRSQLTAPLLFGVGAAFDFHAGTRREAPRWIRDTGLEWVYRLAREPRRLGPRYLRNNPAFVAQVMRRRPVALQSTREPKWALNRSEASRRNARPQVLIGAHESPADEDTLDG